MSKYEPKEFIKVMSERVNGREIPNCPYCGGDKFTTTDKFATIFIGDNLGSINLGPSIPAGLLVCEKCGHIEFFALGSLGLLKGTGEKKNGK